MPSSDGEDVEGQSRTESVASLPTLALSSTSESVRSIVDSLTGMHGYKLSQTALCIADREANAGLTAKAKSVASTIIKKSKSRKGSGSAQQASNARGRKASPSLQLDLNPAKDFVVRAVVLYTNCKFVTNEATGRLSFSNSISPIVAEGPLRDREVMGCAKFDVKFNRDWNSARVDHALRSALPGFFTHCETELGYDLAEGIVDANLRPYVFCYRDNITRKLHVYAKRDPSGEDLYGIKSRKGRGPSESFIHIASVERIDSAATCSWGETAMALSPGAKGDDSGNGSTSETPPEPSSSHAPRGRPRNLTQGVVQDKKGKKRSRSIAVASDDSEIELVGVGVRSGTTQAANSKKSRLLGEIDRALSIAEDAVSTSRSAIKSKSHAKSTAPPVSGDYLFKSVPNLKDFSPSPEPISDAELSVPEIVLDAASNTRPTPALPVTATSTTAEPSESTTSNLMEDTAQTRPFTPPPTPSSSRTDATATARLTVSPTRYDPPKGTYNPWY